MFEHLKRLKLNWDLSSEFDFDKLNQFSALEELDAHIRLVPPTEKILKLPKLRVLDLSFDADRQSKLIVDCPIKVLSIYCSSYRNEVSPASLNFVYPDLLEEIIISGKAQLLNFSSCKNVRISRAYHYLDYYTSESEVFAADHLETFPNLQELYYQFNFYGNASEESHSGGLMNAGRGKISAALQQKKQQNRSVKIFFQGIELEGERFFESLELKEMSDLPTLQTEHYDLLATNLYYYDTIDYSSLEKHFDDLLPADLFNRFTCVNTVIATGGVKHLDQFATFLRQCKYLCQLEVEIDSVDQSFCDQLHVNCFFLKKLVFGDRKKEESSEDGNPGDQGYNLANVVEKKLTITDDLPFKKLSFDFLAKQTNLVVLGVGEFDVETALKCLQICRSNSSFAFKYREGKFSILKSERNKPYSLKATFCESQDETKIKITSKHISFGDLALDLEFFVKKIDNLLNWI